MTMEQLSNITVLIAGGSSGIGNSIARGLIEAGADVYILSRRPPNKWEKPMPQGWCSHMNWIFSDLSDLDSTIHSLNKWLSYDNRTLDVLIYSAVSYGSNKRRPILETALEEWDRVFDVGPRAYFAISKTVLPYLIKRQPSLIISISSEVAYHPGPGRIDYAASKAASKSISRSMAAELNNSLVNVVDFLPEEMVDTPGIRSRRKPEDDLSDYSSPDVFISPVIETIKSMGKGMSGKTFVVNQYAEAFSLNIDELPSQTRISNIPVENSASS